MGNKKCQYNNKKYFYIILGRKRLPSPKISVKVLMTLMTHVLVFLMSHLYHITLQIPFPLKIVRIHPM